jgi:hypothetical protein
MTGTILGPQFRLNLTNISKTSSASAAPAPEPSADPPASQGQTQAPSRPSRSLLKPEVTKASTVKPPESFAHGSTTLARKNLVLGSDSSSDDDLGLELIPVGADDPAEKADAIPDVIEAPSVAISHLPDLAVGEDDEAPEADQSSKLSLLQDMLLSQSLADEPPDVWSYRVFIKQFAHSEASTEAPEGDDEADDGYSLEDEDYDEY